MRETAEVRRGICGLCDGICLMDVHMKDGKIVKVEGNRSLPFSSGKLCAKGAAIRQQIYHPDRLRYPMKRTGARGEGKFQRISWDEALDTIAERMRATKEHFGARETMIYGGHPKWFRPVLSEFAAKYGTPNYGSESSTCAYALMMAAKTCFGKNIMMPMPDLHNCRTLLIWGVNPLYSNTPGGGVRYLQVADRGVNIIAVDPRCTPTTERATIHLRPFPGTDGALALGMARVIITEDLYDHEFVREYTSGFEEYREYAMKFTPEKVEKITGVPAEEMIRAARLFAAEKPSAIQTSASPLVHNINGFQNTRAVFLLSALTGGYGAKGGNVPPGPGRAALDGVFMGKWYPRACPQEDLSHQEFPVWSELIPYEAQVVRMADYLDGKGAYPIRNLIAFGMNHRMWPDPDHLEAAFGNLEFFADVDFFLTESGRYADILLPAALAFEREKIEVFGLDTIYYQPKVLEDAGEVKPDVEIILELGKRLGITIGDPAMESFEDYLNMMLGPTGISLEELKEHPEGMKTRQIMSARTSEQIRKVQTPDGKIEFYSKVLEKYDREGYEALPVYRDYREKLPLEEYPLILATGSRRPQLFHSRTYRLPWIRNLEKDILVGMYPADAEKLGIRDKERVVLRTPKGSLELTAELDSSCLPGVVNVYHGAGCQDINRVLDENYLDPVSGFPGFKSYCCRIEKRKGAEA